MRVLAEKGMVSARPKTGTTVQSRESWRLSDPELLTWLFEERVDPELFRDLAEIRRIIEPAAAALAAERGTEAEIQEVGEWLDVASGAPLQSRERNEADLGVHGAIIAATHNQILRALLGTLQAAMIASRDLTSRIPSNEILMHRRVYEAMVARDSGAAEVAMRELIIGMESDLAAALELLANLDQTSRVLPVPALVIDS
jgi:DNA-binding FadR family transcriptional regulator